ncbi:MAG TPA: LytTR family DNA-binding domain-containing protein [Cyclobacteriaceae bacterium]
MRILIIEDEPLVAKDLQSHLNKLIPEATQIGPLTSVGSATKWFNENALPDLILSDIRLSDGSSFDIFEKLDVNCPIIFTTAYDEYAIRAFKLNSIDYLLKPIDSKELEIALKKYKTLSAQPALADQLKSFLGTLGKEQKKYKERFLSLQRNTMVPVVADEIAFFQKEELIFIYTRTNEKTISEYQTLDEIESLLDPEKFFRVNRQYILHIQSVDRVKTTHKGLTVQLKAPFSFELDISREKATVFKTWLDK